MITLYWRRRSCHIGCTRSTTAPAEPFPAVKAYYERCQARPAWQRTLGLYAERIGVSVDDIR
jgi:glutathione S-transferase